MGAKVTVEMAAKAMGVSPVFVRFLLKKPDCTWGDAVKMSGRWSFVIYPEKFAEHIGKPLDWILGMQEGGATA